MTDSLANAENVELRGFGSFSVRHYDSYVGRNPKTKEKTIVHIDGDKVLAVILTELPIEFPLSTGDSIEIFAEEILYSNKVTEH